MIFMSVSSSASGRRWGGAGDTEAAEDVEDGLLQAVGADGVHPICQQERQKAGTTSLEPSLEF